MIISTAKLYKYKHVCFEWHNYLGPTFCRIKDFEPKNEQYRTARDYAQFAKWYNLGEIEREKYRVI